MNFHINKIFILVFILVSEYFYTQTNENILKAAYLEKFSLFTDWPAESRIEDTNLPFVIGVLGNTEFADAVKKFYKTQKIRNKTVVVKDMNENMDDKGVHLLYISKNYKGNIYNLINEVKNLPVLTVSETEGYAKKGININLFQVENKIRFEINETSLKKNGLQISYHLLKYAKIVSSDN